MTTSQDKLYLAWCDFVVEQQRYVGNKLIMWFNMLYKQRLIMWSTFFKLRMILVQLRICMGLVVDQPCAATPTAIPAPRPPRTRPANATLSRPAFSSNTRPLISLIWCWCTRWLPFLHFMNLLVKPAWLRVMYLADLNKTKFLGHCEMPMSYPWTA